MTSRLGGLPVERASLTLPKWGVPMAYVQVASGELLSGTVTLELAGSTHVMTIVSGNVYRERGWYMLAGGAGQWGKHIGALSYRNAAGVKASQVLGSVARAAGETLGAVPVKRLGDFYALPAGEASAALDLISPEAWYVDEAGVTQVQARPAGAFSQSYVLMDRRPDRNRITVAAENILGLVPGVTIEGLTAATVRHELTPESIRSHVWGDFGIGDRLFGALKKIIERVTASFSYFGRFEYRVESANGTHLDIRPARSALGMPKFVAVPMRTGSPGASGTPAIGSSCEVMFLDGDPSRPVVVGFDGAGADGFTPTASQLTSSGDVGLGDAQGRVLRSGDKISIVGLSNGGGPVVAAAGATVISLDPTLVTYGPPATGYSRAKA